MDIPNRSEVVIIGGGVMGASTAYHLAKLGIKDVILLEKEDFFGQGATGRCAGGVRYQFSTEINLKLSLASLPMLERFKDETGQDINYRKCGYLIIATQNQDVAAFKRNVELQHKLGIQTEWLDGGEVRSRLPWMRFNDALAGTFHQKDGLVDPNSVVMGYISAAQRLGVKAFTATEVTGIKTDSGKVSGVFTRSGIVQTPTVVNAAGPWSKLVGEMAGISLPVVPLRRQMFTTTPLPELPLDFPFVIDFAQSLYFHREGEGLLIGMSNPKEKSGYDQRIDEAFEMINFEAASARLPMLEKAGLVSHWAGLYEVTPDAHPIFGTTPIQGFLVVTGFSGHGFMHGPVAGLLIAELICTGSYKSVDVSTLDFARFEESRLIQEYNVV